jgi:hypothetical protein
MGSSKLNNLTVLRNLLYDDVFKSFILYSEDKNNYPDFLSKLINTGYECNFLSYVQKLILCDVNAFSRCTAQGKAPSVYLKNLYVSDLESIFSGVRSTPTNNLYEIGKCTYPFDECFNNEKTVANLSNFYKTNGYGMFIENVAFLLKDNSLKAILNPSPITVDMLKNYEQEKKIVENNIINFLNDLPYSDMLLYGDRGTGKSSTIHAMLNKYKGQGLRLIEVSKEQILQLGYIKELVCDQPLKFIIFIDDLSLDEYDEKTSSLKASIEGSISGGSKNTMLVATSNRRHIVKETFMDRENSVHASDSLEEQLSLSDRFGITVMFSSTDKSQYLSIVKQLAKDVNLKMDEGELFAIAERWAVSKGGRSPRRAKQIVDLIYSALSRGEEIDF